MGLPAARVGDMHMCPMVTPAVPPVPHVGGPILPPGVPTVLIGKLPAATLGNMCTCVGPPSTIVKGSFVVLIGKKPAARVGDLTAHGGTILPPGCINVLIGDAPSAPPALPPPPPVPPKPPKQPKVKLAMQVIALMKVQVGSLGTAMSVAGVAATVFSAGANISKGIDMASKLNTAFKMGYSAGEAVVKYAEGDTEGAKDSLASSVNSGFGLVGGAEGSLGQTATSLVHAHSAGSGTSEASSSWTAQNSNV